MDKVIKNKTISTLQYLYDIAGYGYVHGGLGYSPRASWHEIKLYNNCVDNISKYMPDLPDIRFSLDNNSNESRSNIDYAIFVESIKTVINLYEPSYLGRLSDYKAERENYECAVNGRDRKSIVKNNKNFDDNKIFIVHGHDNELKIEVARFVEKLGLKAIILHEQANRGQTIIEKIESYSDVGFAIVLYTPDDVIGNISKLDKHRARARQNVVFEHGYLIGKLGRERVAPIVKGSVELPNDISGVVYIGDNWEVDIAKELKSTGYTVDFNKLFNG